MITACLRSPGARILAATTAAGDRLVVLATRRGLGRFLSVH